VLFNIMFVLFGGFGFASLHLQYRFLKRLEAEFPQSYELAGRPSPWELLFPPGMVNSKYRSWCKSPERSRLPRSMQTLFRWSRVTWAITVLIWLTGLALVVAETQ
jgi:hypothetical protein